MKRKPMIHLMILYLHLNNCSAGQVKELLKFGVCPNRRCCNAFPRRELLLLHPLLLRKKRYFELGSFQVMCDPLETAKVSSGHINAHGRYCASELILQRHVVLM